MGGALFVLGMLVRLSPDSARTKNTMANMVASQKIGRATFNLFIVLFLFLRVSVPDFLLHTDRTAADALRFNTRNTAQEVPKKASRICCAESHRACYFHQKKVTELLPSQGVDVWLPSAAPRQPS